jgi:hypothetical protein
MPHENQSTDGRIDASQGVATGELKQRSAVARLELLCDRFGSNGNRSGNEAAFRLNRESIERAASDKYDAGELAHHSDARVIIIAADMASPLSRKV